MDNIDAVGFIGLGQMGIPLAKNLLKTGYRLKIYNRTSNKAQCLVEMGAEVKSQPLQVATEVQVLMTCLSDDRALVEVLGPDGELAKALGPGGIHLSMSTISPKTATRLAKQQAGFGGYYLSVPLLGRPDAVAAKKHAFLLAGDVLAKKQVETMLKTISAGVFDLGEEPASANVAKLALNFLIAAAIEAMAEAFSFATKNDTDPKAVFNTLAGTLFACPVYQNYGRILLEKTYEEPLFKLGLGLKDMLLIAESANTSRTPMRFLRVLEDRFLAAVAHGRADMDWTAINDDVVSEAGI
jgi:3-hydroxyisobutyrate dehydrogenase-like beta-hydroxyacid dehydrogenase